MCILGPSGCGKSTLLHLVASLDHPDSGSIEVGNGHSGKSLASVGIVFQDYALFPWKSVRNNIEYGLKIRGLPKAERRRRAQSYIDLVGLSGFEAHYPHELSGGMQQRAAIARSLAIEPRILLMDEPFAAVDAQLREFLQQELLTIWQQSKRTVLFVTHSVGEAIFLADRIAIMTPRPSKIDNIIDIDLPRPRTPGIRVSNAFKQLEEAIRELMWTPFKGQAEF